MARIAKNKIIWQSHPKQDKDGLALTKRIHGVDTGEPDLDRLVIPAGSPVPKIVPQKTQDKWLSEGMVTDNPDIEAPEGQEGPPDMLLPVTDPKKAF